MYLFLFEAFGDPLARGVLRGGGNLKKKTQGKKGEKMEKFAKV